MSFMIKHLPNYLFIFILCSCAQVEVDYTYFTVFKNTFFPEELNLDGEFYDNADYSSLKIKHQDKEAIYVLSNVSNDVHTWIGKDFEIIKTYRGLIIEMSGIYNLNAHLADVRLFSPESPNTIIRYTFSEPDLVMHDFNLQFISKKALKDCDLYTFNRTSHSIGYKVVDTICFKNNMPYRSLQKLNNLIEEFDLEFNYKF